MPKVSVIIPVYNVENYLRECLDSVVNQTLKDIEIICVDDGSTDTSLEILREYEAKDDRLKVIQQENMGSGAARNNAILKANGEFVAFMDSDDWYPEYNTLELMYNTAKNFDVKICGGSLCVVSEGKYRYEFDERFKGNTFDVSKKMKYSDYQYDYYYQRFIFLRSLLINYDIFFPQYKRFQDPPFFIKAMICADEFYALKDVTYCYRNIPKNFVNDINRSRDILSGLIDYMQFAIDNNMTELQRQCISRCENDLFYLLRSAVEYSDDEIDQKLKMLNQMVQREQLGYDKCYFLKPLEKMRPKVSAIVPVYNVEKYLRECLDSIVNQTLKNIEIICVNDGSTDSSLSILQEYASRDSRIIIISQDNKGLSGARNTGVQYAQGEYLYFIDSDDFIECNTLDYLYTEAKKDDLEILFFDGITFYESDVIQEAKRDYCKRKYEYNKVYTGMELYNQMRGNGDYRPMACTQLIYREYFEEQHLSFIEGTVHEDNIFTLECILPARKCSHRKKHFYHYRKRSGAITTTPVYAQRVLGKYLTVMKMSETVLKNQCDQKCYQYTENYLKWLVGAMQEEYRMLSSEQVMELSQLELYQKQPFEELLKINADDFEIRHIVEQMTASVVVQSSKSNMNIPKISVIIPIYNTAEYLCDCFESIINQTLKDIEIICVNDGSIDESLKICKAYAKNDDRFIVLTQFNSGQGAARNNALKYVTGEYIYFMDSDDKLDVMALEKLYNIAKNDRLDVLYFDADSFYETKALEKQFPQYQNYYHRENDYSVVMTGPEMFVSQKKNSEYRVSPCLQFINKDYLQRKNLHFLRMRCYEDNMFTLLTMLQAEKVKHIPERLFFRRVRNNSTMTRKETYYNFYGYYACYLHAQALLLETKLDAETMSYAIAEMNGFLKNAKGIYGRLENRDREMLKNMHGIEGEFFKRYLLPELESIQKNTIKTENAAETKKIWLLRKIKGGIQCYEEHGMQYTVQRFFYKVNTKINKHFWLYQKICGGMRCYQEHGFKYTFKRVLEHLGIPMGIKLKK